MQALQCRSDVLYWEQVKQAAAHQNLLICAAILLLVLWNRMPGLPFLRISIVADSRILAAFGASYLLQVFHQCLPGHLQQQQVHISW